MSRACAFAIFLARIQTSILSLHSLSFIHFISNFSFRVASFRRKNFLWILLWWLVTWFVANWFSAVRACVVVTSRRLCNENTHMQQQPHFKAKCVQRKLENNRITSYLQCFTNDYTMETSEFTWTHTPKTIRHWREKIAARCLRNANSSRATTNTQAKKKFDDACKKQTLTHTQCIQSRKPTFVN